MITLKKIEKFIKIRNRSDINSNFQFIADAVSAGFKVSELGTATRLEDGFKWSILDGELIERKGRIEFYPGKNDEDRGNL